MQPSARTIYERRRKAGADGPALEPYSPGIETGIGRLWVSRAPEAVIEGPAGTGKTRGVLEKINAALNRWPNSRGLICRQTRNSMTESVLVTFENAVALDNGRPDLSGPRRQFRHSYKYSNGSELIIGGLDRPDRIMSTEYDIIGLFEGTEAVEDSWEKLTTRLRHGAMPFQQGIIDCNPGAPNHWINQRAAGGRLQRFLSRHVDNPILFNPKSNQWTPAGEVYIDRLRALTGHRRARLLDGKWTAATGLVYEDFDKAIHVRPRDSIKLQDHWRRIVAVDFGYRNPFSASWYALGADGEIIRYRQIYFTGRLVEDHARKIRELSQGERIEAYVCDHDAEDRATFERHAQCNTIPAKKEIKPGIQRVISKLNERPRPGLIFLEDSLVERDEELAAAKLPACTEDEIDAYQWPTGADGKPQKEIPIDKDNHGLDELRYAVAYFNEPKGDMIDLKTRDPKRRTADGIL